MTSLVQPILVYPYQPRNRLILDAAIASTKALKQREEDSAWEEWLGNSFTKTVRRIKSAEKLESITRELGMTSHGYASAYKPLAYEDFPSVLRNAQVSHWEQYVLPSEELGTDADFEIVINSDLDMSTGKACAQAAHVLMLYSLDNPAFDINTSSFTVSERSLTEEDESSALASIRDNGLTEVPTGSLTSILVI